MTEQDAPATIWLMQLGEKGKYESISFEQGIALIGFTDFSDDMTGMTEEQIGEMVERESKDEKAKPHDKSMLRMFACRMRVGDGIVVHLQKKPGQIAIGRVTEDYKYRTIDADDDEAKGTRRHLRPVDWLITAMAKSDLGGHLRAYYTARGTIRPIRYPEAVDRIRAVLTDGNLSNVQPDPGTDDEDVDVLSTGPFVERTAHEEIADWIHSRFPAHRLERLVAAILEAEGYVVRQSAKGADQGVDVLAGHGPMGFDSPKICVQVKHTNSPIGAADVQKLRGAMGDFHAEQGLFVSWSDYTSDATNEARRNFFTLRLWNANDVIEAVCRNYERLPEEIRAEIPLQRIWTLVPDDDL